MTDRVFFDLLDSGTFGGVDPPTFRWLDTPLATERTAVWQAIGMVMVQSAVSAADALALLRSFSYSHDRLLDAVSADIVTKQLRVDDLDR